jgi:peroxiredoxin
MQVLRNPLELPDNLPAPKDDGGAKHLSGTKLPAIALLSTDGSRVDLSKVGGCSVVYCYPRTGQPGKALPTGWDEIPGARGCTPQSCSFRDYFSELQKVGVDHLYGLSTQDTDYQREVVERLHLPFQILTDYELKFARALKLPTFAVDGMELLKRLTLVIDNGTITHVFYPVFPPNESAAEVLGWLQSGRSK